MGHLKHWIISVEDHVLEPGHLWQDRVPAKLRDRAPRLVPDENWGLSWVFDGQLLPTSGMAAAATATGAISPNPLDYSELRPGCYEPKARCADMDMDHVLASLCFPREQLAAESRERRAGRRQVPARPHGDCLLIALRARPTEVDESVAVFVDAADRLGVPVPTARAALRVIRTLEALVTAPVS